MKKIFMTMVLAGMVSGLVNAQDLIVLKDAREIEAKVEAVTQTEISYHKWNNLGGPLYTISKSEVFFIKYQNGDKEVISEQTAPANQKSNNYVAASTAAATSKQSKQSNGGAGVNSVDGKSLHKVVFSYSPMKWNSKYEGNKDKLGTFHNIGLLYTNSQLIARFPLYIEFGGGFNWLTMSDSYGESYHGKSYDFKYKYNVFSLTIPVNIVYRLSFLGGKMHLAPYTGFYNRINIVGSSKVQNILDGEVVKEEKYNIFEENELDMPFSRYQLGWQFGASFDYKMLNVFLGYGVDLISLTKVQDGFKTRLNGLQMGIGLTF